MIKVIKFPEEWRNVKLIIDTREPGEMVKEFIEKVGVDNIEVRQLETSDYFSGRVGFERKKDDIINLGDVITKCYELKANFPIAVLIVEHSLDETIRLANSHGIHRNAVLGMVASLVDAGVVPIFAGRQKNLVDLILAISSKGNDDKIRDVSIIEPLRPKARERDYALRAVKGLGIGDKSARDLLEYLGSVQAVIRAVYAWSLLDSNSKKLMGLSGLDSQMETALRTLESKWEKPAEKKKRKRQKGG